MTRKLIAGIFLTAVTSMPLLARADWDDLSQRKANLEQKGTNLENKGQSLEDQGKAMKAEGEAKEAEGRAVEGRGVAAENEGRVVEKKTTTTYRNRHKYVKTTTDKIHDAE